MSPDEGKEPAPRPPQPRITPAKPSVALPRPFEWHDAINQLKPYLFRISTPDGFGTGFLISRRRKAPLCAIATAAHVVDHAHYWEEPLRLYHVASDKTLLLRPNERAVNLNPDLDTASVVFAGLESVLPEDPLSLIEKGYYLKPGVEIGWLGFPAMRSSELCFFSGRVSAYLETDARYLVDGVAINGVSGGPAFSLQFASAGLMGVVSAYIPNRNTGEVLPGVAVVLDVTEYHDLADRFRSLDEAKAQETPPTDAPAHPQLCRSLSARRERADSPRGVIGGAEEERTRDGTFETPQLLTDASGGRTKRT